MQEKDEWRRGKKIEKNEAVGRQKNEADRKMMQNGKGLETHDGALKVCCGQRDRDMLKHLRECLASRKLE